MVRSIEEMNERITRGEAVVLTAQEVWERIKGGEDLAIEDVDVVTTATRAIMSGTYAVLSFPIAEPYSFARAERAWLNGVPASVGPCPNERLGILDLMVFGTSHSRANKNYGGGHLLRELVEGNEVQVDVETNDGKSFTKTVRLEDIPYARIFSTRNAFRNYVAFVNPGNAPVSTIFSAVNFPPGLTCATVSGCGRLNPLQNDPNLETIGVGTRILLNGAQGFVIGTGTRSMPSRPNLQGLADMHQMSPEFMGGFVTSAGAECIGSWAAPIPILNESILENVKRIDRDVQLPIMDVNVRQTICKTSYEDVWGEADLQILLDPVKCIKCERCAVEQACPMSAVTFEGGKIERNQERCFNCGLCSTQCVGGAFSGNLGAVSFEGRKIPVVLRQSDRARAIKLAERLKQQILNGSFRMTQMVERL